MIWNIFKKNKLKSEEGKLRLGFEYFKEFLDSSLTDIKSTSNAANITIPYLELMDKINPDTCAGQVLDETTLPGERETLKNAFKWLLESENAHSSFNMSKQFCQACSLAIRKDLP